MKWCGGGGGGSGRLVRGEVFGGMCVWRMVEEVGISVGGNALCNITCYIILLLK